MVPLSEVGPGAQVRVVELWTGRGLRYRLEQLGLFPGSSAEVLVNDRGHVVVRVRSALVSLSRGVASKILVEEAGGKPEAAKS